MRREVWPETFGGLWDGRVTKSGHADGIENSAISHRHAGWFMHLALCICCIFQKMCEKKALRSFRFLSMNSKRKRREFSREEAVGKHRQSDEPKKMTLSSMEECEAESSSSRTTSLPCRRQTRSQSSRRRSRHSVRPHRFYKKRPWKEERKWR